MIYDLAFSEDGLIEKLAALRWKRRMGFIVEWKDVTALTRQAYKNDIKQILADLKTLLKEENP